MVDQGVVWTDRSGVFVCYCMSDYGDYQVLYCNERSVAISIINASPTVILGKTIVYDNYLMF